MPQFIYKSSKRVGSVSFFLPISVVFMTTLTVNTHDQNELSTAQLKDYELLTWSRKV